MNKQLAAGKVWRDIGIETIRVLLLVEPLTHLLILSFLSTTCSSLFGANLTASLQEKPLVIQSTPHRCVMSVHLSLRVSEMQPMLVGEASTAERLW